MITDICMDIRNEYQDKVYEFIDNSEANGDITSEEAAGLKAQF